MLTALAALCLTVGQDQPWMRPYEGVRRSDIDAASLAGKVVCGYQGWFRTPDDGTKTGWFHWSRDWNSLSPETACFEMWPDVSEYPADALRTAGSYSFADGTPARLFSSVHPGVVDKHFEWMRTYGLDGVFVQRFLGGLDGGAGSIEEARALGYARQSANRHGRIFAVEYDMSGTPPDKALSKMKADWTFLTEKMKITEDPRYLRHNGKPVLAIFGFFTDRMSGAEANAIIDAFEAEGVALVGAGQWWWRRETDPEWTRAFRRFTAYSPWDVGNTGSTDRWKDDLAEARRAGMMLLPVIYPGFSWDNLQRRTPGSTLIPRRKGAYFREQFQAAAGLKIGQVFVAMFDEVDEGTAIFKVLDKPPVQGHFVGLEGLESDAYLKLAGEGTKMIRQAANP